MRRSTAILTGVAGALLLFIGIGVGMLTMRDGGGTVTGTEAQPEGYTAIPTMELALVSSTVDALVEEMPNNPQIQPSPYSESAGLMPTINPGIRPDCRIYTLSREPQNIDISDIRYGTVSVSLFQGYAVKYVDETGDYDILPGNSYNPTAFLPDGEWFVTEYNGDDEALNQWWLGEEHYTLSVCYIIEE